MINLSRAPERLVRSAFLTLVLLSVFTPLALLSPQTRWWQDPRFALAMIVLAGAHALRGELMPELADTWFAERASRYAPLFGGLLIPVSLLFPTLGTWYVLWILWASSTGLLAWSYVPRVRTVTLCLCSAAALGLVVVDARATPTLIPLGFAWVLVPSLDRLAAIRLRLTERPPPTFRPVVLSSAAFLALGGAVYALASALLPPSTRDYRIIDLFAPATESGGAQRKLLVELPSLELFVLLVIIVAALVFVAKAGTGDASDGEAMPELGGMSVGGGRALSPDELERAIESWPRGARRDAVEAYLRHLRQLDALGHALPPGVTPAAHAETVARRLPPELRALAPQIAEAFARARWNAEPVGADVTSQLRSAAKQVEDTLLPPPATP